MYTHLIYAYTICIYISYVCIDVLRVVNAVENNEQGQGYAGWGWPL